VKRTATDRILCIAWVGGGLIYAWGIGSWSAVGFVFISQTSAFLLGADVGRNELTHAEHEDSEPPYGCC